MRDYGSVSPQFWIGDTGKKLRGKPSAQIVALYLMTSPHANMIGVFHCPLLYVAHETGLTVEKAEEAILELEGFDFCTYDRAAEVVFVHSMSAHQVGENLKADDNKVKGVRKEWERISVKSLKAEFARRYADDYHLPKPLAASDEAPSKPLQRVENTPSKQLTGTRQEQEQNQEQEQEQGDKPRAPRKASPGLDCPGDVEAQVWCDFQTLRKAKKAPITETVIKTARGEAVKAGLTFNDFLKIWCNRGSQGLEASWIKPHERGSPRSPPPNKYAGASAAIWEDEATNA